MDVYLLSFVIVTESGQKKKMQEQMALCLHRHA